MEVQFFLHSLCDIRHPPRTCKCIYSSVAIAALPFSGSVTHLLASQAFCGRMHPSVWKTLRASYWRAPQMSMGLLPLLGVWGSIFQLEVAGIVCGVWLWSCRAAWGWGFVGFAGVTPASAVGKILLLI